MPESLAHVELYYSFYIEDPVKSHFVLDKHTLSSFQYTYIHTYLDAYSGSVQIYTLKETCG